MTCILDGVNGYIVKKFDVQDWAVKIIEALDEKEGLIRMGNISGAIPICRKPEGRGS